MRLLTLFLFFASTAIAQPLTVTNTLTNNTLADADAVNQNFTHILDALNTKLGLQSDFRVAIGFEALPNSTDPLQGGGQIAIGLRALKNCGTNSLCRDNIAIGGSAMQSVLEGANNVVIGHEALYSDTNGGANVAVGYQAALSNTEGTSNTAVGASAFGYNTLGNFNTAIGFAADVAERDLTNATAIGANARVKLSNEIQIGNNQITNVYFGRNTDDALSSVNTNLVTLGYLYARSALFSEQPIIASDRRVKKDINSLDSGLNLLRKLSPVTYKRIDQDGAIEMGLIAQDVQTILVASGKEDYSLVHDSSNRMALRYSELVAPIVRAIQELDTQHIAAIEQKDEQIVRLEQKLESQQEELWALVKNQQEQIAQLQGIVKDQFALR